MSYGRKLCLGCRTLGHWDRSGRCPSCLDEHKAKYRDPVYLAARFVWQARLDAGEVVLCPRPHCRKRIVGEFDLGHQSDGTLHPEHPRCNRGARRSKGVVLL